MQWSAPPSCRIAWVYWESLSTTKRCSFSLPLHLFARLIDCLWMPAAPALRRWETIRGAGEETRGTPPRRGADCGRKIGRKWAEITAFLEGGARFSEHNTRNVRTVQTGRPIGGDDATRRCGWCPSNIWSIFERVVDIGRAHSYHTTDGKRLHKTVGTQQLSVITSSAGGKRLMCVCCVRLLI